MALSGVAQLLIWYWENRLDARTTQNIVEERTTASCRPREFWVNIPIALAAAASGLSMCCGERAGWEVRKNGHAEDDNCLRAQDGGLRCNEMVLEGEMLCLRLHPQQYCEVPSRGYTSAPTHPMTSPCLSLQSTPQSQPLSSPATTL